MNYVVNRWCYKLTFDLKNKNGAKYLSMLHYNKYILNSGSVWKYFKSAAKECHAYNVAHFELDTFYDVRSTWYVCMPIMLTHGMIVLLLGHSN